MYKRILLEALITEREGMIAENAQREHLGQSVAYGEEAFDVLAEKIRALIEDAPEEEGEINRKLDALKAVTKGLVVYHQQKVLVRGRNARALSAYFNAGCEEMIRILKEAWKEEEEVQRGPV